MQIEGICRKCLGLKSINSKSHLCFWCFLFSDEIEKKNNKDDALKRINKRESKKKK